MAEYIKREAAIKAVEKYGLTNGVVWGRHTGLAICIASEIADITMPSSAQITQKPTRGETCGHGPRER